MNVSGLATTTLPPPTRPLPVSESFSCFAGSMRNFRANASATIHPTLWRLRAYSTPGLPRPTISFMRRRRVTGRTWRAGQKHAIIPHQSMTERERIVVIDDSANDLQVTRRFLERNGYDVSAATSGEEGLALAAKITPDAIVIDYRMPGMDGFEVT